MTNAYTLPQKLVAEGLGTGLLLAAVVGSGIMAENLSAGNVSLALLENAIATGAVLVALILAFGPISGAHFNPAVTIAEAAQGGLRWRYVPGYMLAQSVGAIMGVFSAHLMFGQSLFQSSTHIRAGSAQLFSEFIATFGLLTVILGCSRAQASSTPFAVGAFITAAYWFTASTSFANPAVTLARTFTNTFAGIRTVDAPPFVVMQIAGAITATALFRWLAPKLPGSAKHAIFSAESRNVEITL